MPRWLDSYLPNTTEADYENSIIELFENLGYRHVYAPDLERDFYSPLYEEKLESALHRLNPEMPEDAIADALYKLKNFENAELVQKNALFMDYLQHGIEVRYFVKGENVPVWFILLITRIQRKTPL